MRKQDEDLNFVRGYGYQAMVNSGNWMGQLNSKGFGVGIHAMGTARMGD